MRFLHSLVVVAGAVVSLPWAPARADRVDAYVGLGKSGRVTVTAPGDTATAAFLIQSGPGKKLAITVKPAAKSALALDVRLVAPDGTVVDPKAAGGKIKVTKSLATLSLPTVPQGGLWRVEVRGASGTAGAANVSVRATDVSTLARTTMTVPASGTLTVPVDVGANQAITVTIVRAKLSTIVPQLRILDPNGQPLADGAFLGKASAKSGAFSLKAYRLPSFGRYELVISGQDGRGGGVTYSARSAPAKTAKGAPVASAGVPSDAEPSTPKGLDGSASHFAGGTGTFNWVQVAGPPVVLTGASTAGPTFVAPAVASSLGFELVVGEVVGGSGGGNVVWSASSPVTVEVGLRPLADAGRSLAVATGATVTLDGSGSKSRRGTPMTQEWTQDPDGAPQVALTGAQTVAPTFTAPSSPAVLHFVLTVDDGTLRSAADSVTVRVGDAQQATPDAGRPQSVPRMATVHLSALATRTASGALDAPLAWTQISGPAVTLADPSSPWPSFTSPKTTADLIFQLSAGGATDRVAVFVRATETDFAPHTSGNGTQTATSGAVTLSDAASTDADADPMTHRWAQVDGAALAPSDPDAAAPVVTLPAGNASRVYAVQADDGLAYGPPDLVAVRNTGFSGKPVANAGADVTATPLQPITLNGAGSGRTQGTGPLTYRWRQVSAKDWFDVAARVPSFDATAASPSFAIPATRSSITPRRTILFELIVNDGTADSYPDLVAVTVTNLPPNLKPKVTAGASDTNPTASSLTTLQGTAFDDDGDPLTVRWTQVSGVTQVHLSNNAALSPTFVAPALGTYTFQIVADDGTEVSAPASVSLVVDQAPVASATVAPANILPGGTGTLNASASADPEGKPLTYRWTQVIPASPLVQGLPADTSTKVWTATVADDPILLSLVVNDGRQDSAPVNLSLNVGAPVFPSIKASSLSVPYGAKATLTGDATGVGPFTYAWSQVTAGANAQDPVCTIASPTSAVTTVTFPLPSTHPFGATPSATFRLTAKNDFKSASVDVRIQTFASYRDKNAYGGVYMVIQVVGNACTNSCHGGNKNVCPVGAGAQGYSLGANYLRQYSINVPSCATGKARIAAGSSANSYMIDVLTGAGTHTYTPSSQTLYMLMDYIDQGALDN